MTLGVAGAVPDWLDVSRETIERLGAFCALVERWTPAINLVSKADSVALWERHLLDSAQLFRLAPPVASWADLGSGGGFPGLVIAILARQHRPQMMVNLVEADRRKAAFLAQAIRTLEVNAALHVARIDSLAPLRAEVVSARALAPLPQLCGMVHRHLSASGVALLPKGEGVQEELRACAGLWQMEVTQVPSLTRAEGVILQIRGLRHV
jgi:16S rRNA (guanine527-N7)-methyltransferase